VNFSGWQARFRRLQDEHATWKLLRADNAPIILAFIADLFAEENEVPFAWARIALDAELERGRELGYWQSESGAGIYLNQWIRAGWLREMDDMLSKTDASEIALRFCRTLDEPTAGTSASHLRIVQEAVRDFAVAVNPDLDERVAQLEQRQQEIQRSIDDLRAGVSVELSETEQRERIREIYQLASVLTGDFRRVEDDIRRIDKDLRIQIIEGDSTRGDVLLELMEKEILLANTDEIAEITARPGSNIHIAYQRLRDELVDSLGLPACRGLSVHRRIARCPGPRAVVAGGHRTRPGWFAHHTCSA
jgi:hypothetical protein